MEIDRAGGFEDAAQLDEAGGHHDEVGEHLVVVDELVECTQHGGYLGRGGLNKLVIGAFGGDTPVPGIIESLELGIGGLAAFVFEEDVIGAVGIERRVEVDEVYALSGNVFTQDGEVVAVVEGVYHLCLFWRGKMQLGDYFLGVSEGLFGKSVRIAFHFFIIVIISIYS